MEDYKVGDVVHGKVTGIEKYGIFLKIDDEYTGLIHISEITDKYINNINKFAEVNEMLFAEVKDINREKKQLILSVKGLNYRKDNDEDNIESVRGFLPLKQHLQVWIDEKIQEYNLKN